jgi:5'(3')-deoxyribonucleotidase
MVTLSNILLEVEASKYKIYCDLDGVMSDFDKRFEHFTGKTPDEYDKELTQQYGKKKAQEMFWTHADKAGTRFWSEMDFMPDAHILWNYIKKYNPIFLSSPSRSQTSKQGKIEWCQKHFPGFELILRQAEQKQQFACETCILIDDRPSNYEQWNAKGGIGIFHTSANNTINQLKKLGL